MFQNIVENVKILFFANRIYYSVQICY